MSIRITCIKKAGGNHESPYVAITSLNWINEANNNTGTTSREDMYDWLVNQKGEAYVRDSQGNKATLFGEISSRGTKFVKTRADNVVSDNLLKLSECVN
jgi:hypothetical protein